MAALPEVLTAGSMQLRCWSPSFAEAMLIAIEESYPELKQWMPWAQEMPTVDGLRGVLRQGELDFHAGKGWEYTIFGADSDDVMGAAGLHRTDEPGRFEIGYWVRSNQTRRGIATLAAQTLVSTASTYLGRVGQIAIRMDQANLASAAIPRKLGFALDGQEDREVAAAGHTGRGYVWILDL